MCKCVVSKEDGLKVEECCPRREGTSSGRVSFQDSTDWEWKYVIPEEEGLEVVECVGLEED